MYGLRGCEPCLSCMGLGLLKELKFSKVCLKNLPLVQTERLGISSQHLIAVVLMCAVLRYIRVKKCRLSFILK